MGGTTTTNMAVTLQMTQIHTCNRGLDVNHRLLLAEKGGTFIDDTQGGRLLDASLQDKVLLEDIRPRFSRLGVKHLGHRQLATGRKWYTCNDHRKKERKRQIKHDPSANGPLNEINVRLALSDPMGEI